MGGVAMATGSCRRCGSRPRRVGRGHVEPLCEECYREAMDKVARELAEEAATDGRARFRRMKLVPGARPAERPPERVAPVARAGGRPRTPQSGESPPRRQAAPGSRTRCISEEVLCEARRLYALGLSLRAVAETLLDQTRTAPRWRCASSSSGAAGRCAVAHRPRTRRARKRARTWPAPPERRGPKRSLERVRWPLALPPVASAAVSSAPRITVVGSANIDFVARCAKLPRPGETVTDAVLERFPGGKGANQAVAAARLGARARFVGRIGRDELVLRSLEREGVDTSGVVRDEGESGVALILVEAGGENLIAVAPGANRRLMSGDVDVGEADALICQLEIPSEAVAAAAAGAPFFCLNAAPAAGRLELEPDLLVVNRYEFEVVGLAASWSRSPWGRTGRCCSRTERRSRGRGRR